VSMSVPAPMSAPVSSVSLPAVSSCAAESGRLAGGVGGPGALRPLVAAVLEALGEGAAARGGPVPRGGPQAVAARVRAALGEVVPESGSGAVEALRTLVRVVAEGAADPADPLCAAHLHCPPLAVGVAAELAASAVNPSMDSWDQAPAASEVEALTCRALARAVFARGGDPDALVTTGGTESNRLGVLLVRESWGPRVRVVCGANAHHSVHRAAWLLGLEAPLVVPAPRGVLDPGALDGALASLAGRPAVVVATAGTTDAGLVDPLPEVADVVARHAARLHVDAAYGGPLVFSDGLGSLVAGLERADSVTWDLHKLGWQPVAAGLFVVPEASVLGVLDHRADYLNADDDTAAGLPDLLGRSLRTTRRPDVLKMAVSLRALGRRGMGELVERTCGAARELARLVAADDGLELWADPVISTVNFRPAGVTDGVVAAVRRRLLAEGGAVVGRAELDGRLWLKATLLHPWVSVAELRVLVGRVRAAVPGAVAEEAALCEA
jgi:L-2,4-diaminobutyrate decarboxylase